MNFFSQHLLALKGAWRRLTASLLNTLLSLTVIGVALALPTAGWVVLDNLQQFAGQATGTQQSSLFMNTEANRKHVTEIESRLNDSQPGRWRFVPRDEALKRLKSIEGMGDVVAGLSRNPLPDAFIVEPADTQPEAMEELAATFRSWPGVAHVQLDSAWNRRLDAFLRVGKLSVMLLAGVFAGALIAVTFNTIRLQILAQAAEIEVARLIGATDAFIRRPFHYFGALQGALGGLFAVALVIAGGQLLAGPFGELIDLYQGSFAVRGLTPQHAAGVAGTGAVLGWLGAKLSVAIYLRRIS